MLTPEEIRKFTKKACEDVWLDKHLYCPHHRTGWRVWEFKQWGTDVVDIQLRFRQGRKYSIVGRKSLHKK